MVFIFLSKPLLLFDGGVSKRRCFTAISSDLFWPHFANYMPQLISRQLQSSLARNRYRRHVQTRSWFALREIKVDNSKVQTMPACKHVCSCCVSQDDHSANSNRVLFRLFSDISSFDMVKQRTWLRSHCDYRKSRFALHNPELNRKQMVSTLEG